MQEALNCLLEGFDDSHDIDDIAEAFEVLDTDDSEILQSEN